MKMNDNAVEPKEDEPEITGETGAFTEPPEAPDAEIT